MASPFAMFRRNQQTLLVVLFILAIFAFTLSSLLTSQTLNLPMLGLILGTCIMTVVGVILKEPAKYAAIGAFGGLLIGFGVSFIVKPDAPDTIARTNLGTISKTDMERILAERSTANRFIAFAAQKALGTEQAMQLIDRYSFGITRESSPEEAVLNVLLLEEAKRLGISIDKQAVSDYINRATDNKLSKTAYKEVLESVPVTDGQLYRILQNQITIKTAQQQLAPSGFMTPDQYWEMFKKLNFSQKIQSVAVPVEAFTADIPKPDDSELKAFFEAHKNNYPGEPLPESADAGTTDAEGKEAESKTSDEAPVGFRQPRKVQLAYLEARYLDLEPTVGEITDKQVEDHYETYKDVLYLNRQVPDDPLGGDPFSQDSRGGTTGPNLIEPGTSAPDVDFDSLFPDTKPGSDESTTKPGQESPPDAPLKADKPAPSKPESTPPKGQTPDLPKLPQLPDPGKKPDSGRPDSQSLIDRAGTPLQTVAFLQEEKAEKETEKAAEKPESPDGREKTATNAGGAEEKQPATTRPSDPLRAEKPDGEGEKSGKNAIPPAPEGDALAPLRAPKPVPKYQPLDDILRDEIRDALLRQKTNEKQRELAEIALTRMSKLSDEYFALQDKDAIQEFAKQKSVKEFAKQRIKELKAQLQESEISEQVRQQRTEELKKLEDLSGNDGKKLSVNDVKNLFTGYAQKELQELARQYGLTYRQTPLLSGAELSVSNEYSIGSAMMGMELSNSNRETVTDYVFKSLPESVYETNPARSLSPDCIYVFWKTADRESHVPTWEEKGIREEVLEAWNMKEARPKARTRAEKLADRLRDAKETWSDLLLQETVTGDKEGILLQPLISDSFTWLRTITVPGPRQLPEQFPMLTDVSTIENAGPKFMEAVFDEMKEGDVGVVPNDDFSVYYVVQIRDRRPPDDPDAIQAQRDLFLKTNLFPINFMQITYRPPYAFLVSIEGGQLYRGWLDDLKRKYEVEIVELPKKKRS